MNDLVYPSNDIVYPSKVDVWLILVIAGTAVVVGWAGYNAMQTDPNASKVLFASAALIVIIVFGLAVPCRYTLKDDHLIIRAGLIRFSVQYSDVVSVEPSRNPLSAPALSLKRVKIKLKRGYQLVSPKDRDGFMSELKKRARL